MTNRERAEKLYLDLFGMGTHRQNKKDIIEAAFKEIEAQAYERAATIADEYLCSAGRDIRALIGKDPE